MADHSLIALERRDISALALRELTLHAAHPPPRIFVPLFPRMSALM